MAQHWHDVANYVCLMVDHPSFLEIPPELEGATYGYAKEKRTAWLKIHRCECMQAFRKLTSFFTTVVHERQQVLATLHRYEAEGRLHPSIGVSFRTTTERLHIQAT